MDWQDEGIILASRRHGEGGVILELMTCAHGRHFGLVRGGRGRRYRPLLQPGNELSVTWRARLAEHLGVLHVELKQARAAELMENRLALAVFHTLAAHLHLIPEREPHAGLYHGCHVILDHIDAGYDIGALMVRFEVELLRELGIGLDLSRCAATGRTDDLIYVSPRSGRAVSREAGAPYKAKLLPLPAFLRRNDNPEATAGQSPLDPKAVFAGLSLSGYFLGRDAYGERGMDLPLARAQFVRFLEMMAESTKLETSIDNMASPLPRPNHLHSGTLRVAGRGSG